MTNSELLKRLREEAIALACGASISSDLVEDWRKRTLRALEEACGLGSSPVRDFSRIKFDDTMMIDAAERILREKAAETGINLDALKIQLPPAEEAFRRRLYEAAELLLSLTI